MSAWTDQRDERQGREEAAAGDEQSEIGGASDEALTAYEEKRINQAISSLEAGNGHSFEDVMHELEDSGAP
jgi:hypothetical protein